MEIMKLMKELDNVTVNVVLHFAFKPSLAEPEPSFIQLFTCANDQFN